MLPLLREVHEQVQVNESTAKHNPETFQAPENVMGLHPSSHDGFRKYAKRLNPNNPHDQRILNRIANGD